MRLSLAAALVAALIGASSVAYAEGPAPPAPRTPAEQAEIDACLASGEPECARRLLSEARALTSEERRALSAALGIVEDFERTDPRALFGEQRARGDRAGACRTARRILSSPRTSPAQRRLIQQYIAAQCR